MLNLAVGGLITTFSFKLKQCNLRLVFRFEFKQRASGELIPYGAGLVYRAIFGPLAYSRKVSQPFADSDQKRLKKEAFSGREPETRSPKWTLLRAEALR